MATQGQLPPGFAEQNRGPAFRGYCIFLTVLTVLSIVLRLWSRGLNAPHAERRRFWWDDFAAVVSVPFILAQLALAFKLLDLGIGHHIAVVPPANIEPILKALLATYLVYGFALTITKASALLFLHRIFPRHTSATWFKAGLWIAHIINIAWLVAYTLLEIFQCKPISKFWKPMGPGKCLLQSKIYIGAAAPSVAIDLLVLMLPLPLLWGLHTSRARKLGIIIVFILGYCVVVVSIGRLVVAVTAQKKLNEDLTYAGVESFYWGVSEAPITLFSICFPAMLTLGRRLQTAYFSPLASRISSVLESFHGTNSRGLTSHDPEGSRPGSDRSGNSDKSKRSGRRHYASIGLTTMDSMESGSYSGTLRDPTSTNHYSAKVGIGRGDQFNDHGLPQKSIRVDNHVTVHRQ